MAPVSVIEPPEVIESVPLPRVELPMMRAPLLTRLTLLAPELFKETEPVKLLPLLLRLMAPALPVKLAVPALAAWVMAVLAA